MFAARQNTIDRIALALDEFLEPRGFVRRPGRFEWERRSEWKIEEIDLGVKHGATSVLPSLRLAIPMVEPPPGETCQYIAQVNVDQVLHPDRTARAAAVPTFALRIGGFVDSIVSSLDRALDWFMDSRRRNRAANGSNGS